jgi:general secretion pathway protein A
MEQIRLLTNLETDEKKLLQIIFIGQPELNDILAKDELRQLAQRITARFHIEPLSAAETKAYIRHRLMIAGMAANQTLFNQAAVKVIFTYCKGIPRLINVACDRALLGAYTNNLLRVDREVAYAAVMESTGKKSVTTPGAKAPLIISGALTLVILSILVWVGIGEFSNTHSKPITPVVKSETIGVIQRNSNLLPPTLEPTENTQANAPKSFTSTDIINRSFLLPDDALNQLQQQLGVFSGNLNPACERLEFYGVNCLNSDANSWNEFKSFNRPSILELGINNQTYYLAISGINGNQLQIADETGTTLISMFELGQYWTGKFTLLWQPPESFRSLAKIGDRSPFIAWIAGSFASIDNQSEPLTNSLFNEELAQRVSVFQEEADLDPDGIVGVKTVLKINDYLKNDFTLHTENKVND